MTSNKIALIRMSFAGSYTKCDGFADDRMLFQVKVNNLVGAVKEFEGLDIKNPILKSAFGDKFRKEMEEIKELETSLKKRKML